MKARQLIAIAGATAAFASWLAIGIGFALDVDRQTWVILVITAAFATEAMIWCMAAALGLTLLQSRRRVWQWIAERVSVRRSS